MPAFHTRSYFFSILNPNLPEHTTYQPAQSTKYLHAIKQDTKTCSTLPTLAQDQHRLLATFTTPPHCSLLTLDLNFGYQTLHIMRPASLARRTDCDRHAFIIDLCYVGLCHPLHRTRGLAGLLRFNSLILSSAREQSLSSSSMGVPVSVIPVASPTSSVAARSAHFVPKGVALEAYTTCPAHVLFGLRSGWWFWWWFWLFLRW